MIKKKCAVNLCTHFKAVVLKLGTAGGPIGAAKKSLYL